MRVRPFAVLALSVAVCGLVAADDPPAAGKFTWAKDYPKVIDAKPGEAEGAVELLGVVEPKPGWTVKKVLFDYTPRAGGALAKPTELKFLDKKWGALDKDKKKVVPAKVPMDKGEWQVRVTVLFEGTDPTGKTVTVPYQVPWKTVEVK